MESKRLSFDSPKAVGWLMIDLFALYLKYQPISFLFEWLQKTQNFELRCTNTTGTKAKFPASPELLQAIYSSKNIAASENLWLPNNWNFDCLIESGVHEVLGKIPFVEAQL